MKLTRLRISNFQSFGPAPTELKLVGMTFLLGPNGAGKTAALQALSRLFDLNPSQRRLRPSDFHKSPQRRIEGATEGMTLWIEAEFEFAELAEATGLHATIPGNFAHMRLESLDGMPRIRIRLTATMDLDGEIEEALVYVTQTDANGEPTLTEFVPKQDRNSIQVHYLPARRDPGDHISYAAGSLLGRALRATSWRHEQDEVSSLTGAISETLAANAGVAGIGQHLASHWSGLHKGTYYANPRISFGRSEIDNLLRHMTVGFAPGHGTEVVDFSLLSDGQQSLLYISVVLAMQAIGRDVLNGKLEAFDVDKLRPAVFTLIAVEEPENSLSPHYLGRVIKALTDFADNTDAQAIVATHAPALLRRVQPEHIRYLRLDSNRRTSVRTIVMPAAADEAHKYVREAVQAFPEIYFSRLVILGEGDSEEIVLPRLLQARGVMQDDMSVVVAPLGGRHVNHFWRLLNALDIPYVTLLDLDRGRYQGGWGRVKYVARQLFTLRPTNGLTSETIDALPGWNGTDAIMKSNGGVEWLKWLESQGVFFSSPLDLDFAMLFKFSNAFGVTNDELVPPDAATITSVLGKNAHGLDQYDATLASFFGAYHRRFKLGSKPTAHISALSLLDDATLVENMPPRLSRLIDAVESRLKEIPE